MTRILDRNELITSGHLEREAHIYIRQSTLTQVREHSESLERQYELVERARQLGWPLSRIMVVDEDLGRSGAESNTRQGFKGLVAAVGLGRVGIILGIEVSRLARNNTDWYQLLDLCALTDTLLADGDGLYHPARFNDRLVLGLKGTMSEAELHVIRHRLTEGLMHKAAKGELRQGLPVGYVYSDDDKVIVDPDESVVAAIATVYKRFDELHSARQVLLSLREDNLSIPRRRNGSKRITWDTPTYQAIHGFLTNPCYGGAFVFGRYQREKRIDPEGRLINRSVSVPMEKWMVLIPNHHQGYVSWERYLEIQVELRNNFRRPIGEAGGAIREGAAYLQGIIRCGKCGRKMQVGYSGPKGNFQRYICTSAKTLYGDEKSCQSVGGIRLDQKVIEEIFRALEPAAMAATARALEDFDARAAERLAVFELTAERARYEADRAQRRFDAVEPENRLVARRLESALEAALVHSQEAAIALDVARHSQPKRLSAEEISWLTSVGADIEKVFWAPTTTMRDRKALIRAIITEVVVTVEPERREADVTVIFEGGSTTSFTLQMNKYSRHRDVTDETTVDLIRRLANHYDDRVIALVLARQGRRTMTGLSFTRARVAAIRTSHGIPSCPKSENVPASCNDEEVVSITRAEKVLGVNRTTIYRWLKQGFIVGEQLTPEGPWHIRITEDLLKRIVPEIPAGWVGLDEAARLLGVARQTVLHKVQRGQLEAVYVNRGRKKGLRINTNQVRVGLFETDT